MHKFFSLLLLLSFSKNLYPQENIFRKEIEMGLTVDFPTTPKYNLSKVASSYQCATTNCIFVVLNQRNAFPDYPRFILESKYMGIEETQRIENLFLDSILNGKMEYLGADIITKSKIKIGDYFGRKVSYIAINPVNGERGKRHTIILLVRDNIINFDCIILKDNYLSMNEKNAFLNSIKSN